MMVRFLVQTRDAESTWETVQVEELIGGGDHQFALSDATGVRLHYWSHLLPDKSLWTEAVVSMSEGRNENCAAHCESNRPKVLWKGRSENRHWQVIIVYELLKPCDGELI